MLFFKSVNIPKRNSDCMVYAITKYLNAEKDYKKIKEICKKHGFLHSTNSGTYNSVVNDIAKFYNLKCNIYHAKKLDEMVLLMTNKAIITASYEDRYQKSFKRLQGHAMFYNGVYLSDRDSIKSLSEVNHFYRDFYIIEFQKHNRSKFIEFIKLYGKFYYSLLIKIPLSLMLRTIYNVKREIKKIRTFL